MKKKVVQAMGITPQPNDGYMEIIHYSSLEDVILTRDAPTPEKIRLETTAWGKIKNGNRGIFVLEDEEGTFYYTTLSCLHKYFQKKLPPKPLTLFQRVWRFIVRQGKN